MDQTTRERAEIPICPNVELDEAAREVLASTLNNWIFRGSYESKDASTKEILRRASADLYSRGARGIYGTPKKGDADA